MPIPLLAAVAASAIPAITNLIGSVGQANEAKAQESRFNAFMPAQRDKYSTSLDQLVANAGKLSTYKGDISAYKGVEAQAAMNKRMASGGRVAGMDIAREQIKQSTASNLKTGLLGARSGTDVMSLAALSQAQEQGQLQDLEKTGMQTSQYLQQQADQAQLAALGQTAAALTRQNEMEYESANARDRAVLNMEQLRAQGLNEFDLNMFGQRQALSGSIADAKAALWNNAGGVLGAAGKGWLGLQQANEDRSLLEKIYKVKV